MKAIKQVVPQLSWDLDSRHTNWLFRFARQAAEERIAKERLRLIELEYFEPQPQTYNPVTGTFEQFDRTTKQDRINNIKHFIENYERIARFCLIVENAISNYEAEEFGKQMAEMFRERKPQPAAKETK
jgi:phosphoribulokinase